MIHKFEIQYKDYRIFYRFDGSTIHILDVFHGAQLIDPESLID